MRGWGEERVVVRGVQKGDGAGVRRRQEGSRDGVRGGHGGRGKKEGWLEGKGVQKRGGERVRGSRKRSGVGGGGLLGARVKM